VSEPTVCPVCKGSRLAPGSLPGHPLMCGHCNGLGVMWPEYRPAPWTGDEVVREPVFQYDIHAT